MNSAVAAELQTAINDVKTRVAGNEVIRDALINPLKDRIGIFVQNASIGDMDAKSMDAFASLLGSFNALLESQTKGRTEIAKLVAKQQEIDNERGASEIVGQFLMKLGRTVPKTETGTLVVDAAVAQQLEERAKRECKPIEDGELVVEEQEAVPAQ